MTDEDRVLRIRYDQIIRLQEKLNELEDALKQIGRLVARTDINADNRRTLVSRIAREGRYACDCVMPCDVKNCPAWGQPSAPLEK